MAKPWPIMVLALAGCDSQPDSDATARNQIVDQASAAPAPNAVKCDPPKLDFRAASNLGPTEQARFTENFRVAFYKACGEKLFADAPLIDENSKDKSTLFVMNAPEANVTSIYFGPSAAPPAMLLESPFGSPPQIPSADDLHEAIYCTMRGATPQEEEETGRCLPD